MLAQDVEGGCAGCDNAQRINALRDQLNDARFELRFFLIGNRKRADSVSRIPSGAFKGTKCAVRAPLHGAVNQNPDAHSALSC